MSGDEPAPLYRDSRGTGRQGVGPNPPESLFRNPATKEYVVEGGKLAHGGSGRIPQNQQEEWDKLEIEPRKQGQLFQPLSNPE